jgi:hypothetical protein
MFQQTNNLTLLSTSIDFGDYNLLIGDLQNIIWQYISEHKIHLTKPEFMWLCPRTELWIFSDIFAIEEYSYGMFGSTIIISQYEGLRFVPPSIQLFHLPTGSLYLRTKDEDFDSNSNLDYTLYRNENHFWITGELGHSINKMAKIYGYKEVVVLTQEEIDEAHKKRELLWEQEETQKVIDDRKKQEQGYYYIEDNEEWISPEEAALRAQISIFEDEKEEQGFTYHYVNGEKEWITKEADELDRKQSWETVQKSIQLRARRHIWSSPVVFPILTLPLL